MIEDAGSLLIKMQLIEDSEGPFDTRFSFRLEIIQCTSSCVHKRTTEQETSQRFFSCKREHVYFHFIFNLRYNWSADLAKVVLDAHCCYKL